MKCDRAGWIRCTLPLLIACLACTFSSTLEPEASLDQLQSTATDTPYIETVNLTRTPVHDPTSTNTPIPTLSPTVEINGVELFQLGDQSIEVVNGPIDIKSVLFFGGGAGGGGNAHCDLVDDWSPPYVGRGTNGFCVLGIPSDAPIKLSLYSPDGELAGTVTLIKQDSQLDELHEDEERIIEKIYPSSKVIIYERTISEGEKILTAEIYDEFINIDGEILDLEMFYIHPSFPPVGYPSGNWKFAFEYGEQSFEQDVNIQHPGGTHINIMRTNLFNPLMKDAARISNGDTFYIVGTGYEPRTDIPLGFFTLTNEKIQTDGIDYFVAEQISSMMVKTDAEGNFWFPYTVSEDESPQGFYIIDLLDPDRTFSMNRECFFKVQDENE